MPSHRPAPASASRTRIRTTLTGAEKGASGSPPEARAFVGVGFVPRRAAGLVIALTGREFTPRAAFRPNVRLLALGAGGPLVPAESGHGAAPGRWPRHRCWLQTGTIPQVMGARGDVHSSKVRGAAGRDRRGNRSLPVRAVGAVRPRVDRASKDVYTILSIVFWILAIVLVVTPVRGPQGPGRDGGRGRGSRVHAVPLQQHPGGPVLAADPAVRRVRVPRGRAAQVRGHAAGGRRRVAPGLLEERGRDPGAPGRRDHVRVVSRLPQHPDQQRRRSWFA